MKTINDLKRYAIKFLKNNYLINLEDRIVINSTMKSGYGYVKICDVYNRVKEIGININVIKYGHSDVILDTLKHELIHYALFKLGKPYKDSDNYFKDELIKHQCNAIDENGMIGIKYKYTCRECLEEAVTSLNSIYKCKCGSILKDGEKWISDGKELVKC